MNGSYYNNKFYDHVSNKSYISAKKILTILGKYIPFNSMLDIGAGRGSWCKAYAELKNDNYLAIDGDYVKQDELLIDKTHFVPADLTAGFDAGKRFDLAICMEVGEHLPDAVSGSLIRSLTQHADAILFSAALPGQQGTYHINEQYPEYWDKLFKQNGYTAYDIIRDEIWDDKDIEVWYRQNILLYLKDTARANYPNAINQVPQTHLTRIHPELFLYYSEKSKRLDSWKRIINYRLYLLKKRFT